MAKYSIDDILDRLGVDPDKGDKPKSLPEGRKPSPDDKAIVRPRSNLPVVAGESGIATVPGGAGEIVGATVNEIYDPAQEDSSEQMALSELLLHREVVTREQMTIAQQVLKQTPGSALAQILIEKGADEVEIQRAVAELARVPFERIEYENGMDAFDGGLVQRLGLEFCKRHLVLPIRRDGRRVVIGATRPNDVFLLDEIKRSLGVPSVKLVLVAPADVRGAIELMDDGEDDTSEDLDDILADVQEIDVELSKDSEDDHNLEARAGESPVIRYVNYIIQTAIREGASDIHVEPGEKKLRVRYRIDGTLFEMMNPPPGMSAAIISRLKIMANLDISERRIPQDGRIKCVVQGRKLDLRVSTLPTAHGEKTVMRILDTKSINVQLEDLGFGEQTLELWKQQIRTPHGIVLVTGPTGSGKTTTLYSSLRQLDKNKLNISTVEDPVEYSLDGVTQTQTHEKIGMTFAAALRAMLRQDPDIIMLGEIRDFESAQIAVQAALTGHLVLSTLHTNDAPSSITRLVNIGLEPFLLGAAINGVLAQRLARRLCSKCKEQGEGTQEMLEYFEMQGLAVEHLWEARGCDKCRNTGYSGRVGIYELLVVDDALRDIIARNPNVAEFRRLCLERGMISLRDDGMQKVARGDTSVQEILRITKEAS